MRVNSVGGKHKCKALQYQTEMYNAAEKKLEMQCTAVKGGERGCRGGEGAVAHEGRKGDDNRTVPAKHSSTLTRLPHPPPHALLSHPCHDHSLSFLVLLLLLQTQMIF